MNQRLISLVTVAVLMVLVALPLLFIVLQAVFRSLALALCRARFPGYARCFLNHNSRQCLPERCKLPQALRC